MTRIVLGLDDDPFAADLVRWVARQPAEPATAVTVVHVVHRSEVWALASVMIDSSRYLHSVRRRFERCAIEPLHERGVHASLTMRLGDPAHELASVARAIGADEIVVGAGAHVRRHHLIGGDVPHRLEHLVAIPVTVVPHARVGSVALDSA